MSSHVEQINEQIEALEDRIRELEERRQEVLKAQFPYKWGDVYETANGSIVVCVGIRTQEREDGIYTAGEWLLLQGGHGHEQLHGQKPGETYRADHDGLANSELMLPNRDNEPPSPMAGILGGGDGKILHAEKHAAYAKVNLTGKKLWSLDMVTRNIVEGAE